MEFIEKIIKGYKNPAIMCSFGKDSMVMLHLIRSMGYELPVIFHREPFFPEKYEFANKIIQEWGLTVYDYPPIDTAVFKKNGFVEIINYYQARKKTIMLPTGIIEPDYTKKYLCGLTDLLQKPLGNYTYKWDVVFIGHKSSDVDPLQGSVKLHLDLKINAGSVDLAFPLRNWTDDDIWDYMEKNNVPYQENRYKERKELTDKTYNPDYFPTCTRCLDKDNPSQVECPKLNMVINNISSVVKQVDNIELDYYGGNNGQKKQVPQEVA